MRIALLLLIHLHLFLSVIGSSNNLTRAYLKPDSSGRHKNKSREIILPDPGNTVKKLFYIQRDPNTNTIVYELNNDKDGKLIKDEPVHPYWIKYAEKGQKEELNYIQRKFAYGLTAKPVSTEKYDIRFVSYKKFPLTLMKGEDEKYHIFAVVEQKQLIINRIFVKIEGGSFWIPNVIYVEVRGTDPVTGREIVKRFKP